MKDKKQSDIPKYLRVHLIENLHKLELCGDDKRTLQYFLEDEEMETAKWMKNSKEHLVRVIQIQNDWIANLEDTIDIFRKELLTNSKKGDS